MTEWLRRLGKLSDSLLLWSTGLLRISLFTAEEADAKERLKLFFNKRLESFFTETE